MANAKNENGVHGFAYMKPPDKTTWEAITTAIYDKSDNTVLGRTPKNWGQLLIFYTIFYIVLAALFAICMQGLFATLDDKEPKWILDRSLIGTNPGMGFRPISNNTEEGSLIWYNMKNSTTMDKWIKLMNKFIDAEYTNSSRRNRIICDFNKLPDHNETCDVDVESFGECSQSKNFGYDGSSPCVFLKLNRIYGWVPEYYNDTNTLPDDMPEDLKKNISIEIANGRGNQIWISCTGENSVDDEHLAKSKFEYFPNKGFPGYYYPFTNVDGYQSPLIAVRVVNPSANVLISIQCRAWAKNIYYNGGYRDRQGSVQFELMIDG